MKNSKKKDKALNIRVTEETLKQIKFIAEKEERSQATVIIRLIREKYNQVAQGEK